MPTREELESLAQIFGNAKNMDNMWVERPVGMAGDSNSIRGEIERYAQMGRQSPPHPQTQSTPVQQIPPQFQPPQIDPATGLPVDISRELGSSAIPEQQYPIPTHNYNPIPTHGNPESSALDKNQMEFNFNLTEQQTTNEYLSKIYTKQDKILGVLTKILKVIENKNERITKLK